VDGREFSTGTVRPQDGVIHMEGLRDPVNNCTACHGDDLRGGDDGEPSCYSSHGKKWP